MSINAQIRALVEAGKLAAFLPVHSRKPARRTLFLAEKAVEELNSQSSAMGLLGYRGEIFAQLNRWTLGERVWADEKGKPRFLKRLCPPSDEVWEIKVTAPSTKQARLFCRFAEADTLILTHCHSRDYLGEKGSLAWEQAKADCIATWRRLFPDHSPFIGRTIHDYVTEECDGFEIGCE